MTYVIARTRALARQPQYVMALIGVFLTLAVVVAQPAGAGNDTLMVSLRADRGGAIALEGATLSGPAYVFLTTTENVQRVVFSLDGSETIVENIAPYDFAGTNPDGVDAKPWSTGSVGDGVHTISARISLVGGGDISVSSSFTIGTPPPPAPVGTGTLQVSQSANRSGALALEGASLQGNAYVFLSTSTSASSVRFSLDGAETQLENSTPYDFRGGDAAKANAWATTAVANGSHSISALVTPTTGSPFTVTASFSVVNGAGSGTATPTATPAPAGSAPSGQLLVSGSAGRGGASALGSASLSGNAFVFVTAAVPLSEVQFRLDGAFVRTEKVAAYDFRGTAQNGSALPWDTTKLTDGAHTIEAILKTSGGVTSTLSASVVIDNNPNKTSDSGISTTSTDSTGPSISLFVSQSANRAGALALGTEPLIGDVYVFAVPSTTSDVVRFYIDPEQQPLPVRTEQLTPFDLGGTKSGGNANPFDVRGLEAGEHTLLAVAEFGGKTVSKAVSFTVEHPAALPAVDYTLVVSELANRSTATALDGATLEDSAYIFVTPTDHVEQASFYLDDPARSSADRVDSAAPFDFVGGSASAAQPFELDELTAGDHLLTVVLTRTDGTTVEVYATFTAGGTILPNGAVLIKTSDNAAQIAGQHGPGSTFMFEAGTHRGVSITPQSGDVFLGAPGAILSGAKVLPSWNSGSGYWYVGGQTSQLTGNGGCAFNEDGTRYDACQYPEQLFVDGVPWWQVTSIGQLSYGRWYFDYGSDRVYIGANPAGHTVELSTVPNAFSGSASGVTISGLVIEKYANRAQTGAIEGSGSNSWIVSGNELRLNHGYGLRVGRQMQVMNNNVHHNGQLGVGGVGNDILVQGNEIAYNHTGGFLLDWEAGGTKFVLTNRLVFRNNWVHHNDGRGFWTDIENINVLVVDNLVEYNSKGGIVHEIGYAAEFRNNVSRYNGHGFSPWVWGAQIVIQNSSDVLVTGNDVTVPASGGGNGISIIDQNRGNGSQGAYRSDRVTVTGNTIRHLGNAGTNGAPNGCNQDNTFNNNTYIAPAKWFQSQHFDWCGMKNWDGFRNIGQEAGGTAVTN